MVSKINGFKGILLLACTFLPLLSYGQVTIAPTSLYMDDHEQFATMLVLNGSDQTQEVTIDFEFGYLGADEEGNTRMIYDDEDAEEDYSIADKVRAFPRNFTLDPNERQTVRMTARNTADLEDGTYWTRVRTQANPQSPPLEQQEEDEVAAQINFRVEQVTAAFLKKGEVSTGLDIHNMDVSVDEGMGTVQTELSQTGNSPFIGQLHLRILDENDEAVVESRNTVAIYFDTKRSFEFNAQDLPAGSYTAELTFETKRNDVDSNDLVSGDTIVENINFDIQ